MNYTVQQKPPQAHHVVIKPNVFPQKLLNLSQISIQLLLKLNKYNKIKMLYYL